MAAYHTLFRGDVPEFAVKRYDCDDAFGYRRVAGPNSIEIRRVTDLDELLKKVPLRPPALAASLGHPIDLSKA